MKTIRLPEPPPLENPTAAQLVAELVSASYQVAHKQTGKVSKRQDRAAAAVLKAMLGRKPTKEEIETAVCF
jgi:hypothetical protein